MDGIGEIFAAILEVIVRLLYGVIRIIIRTIGLLMSRTWLVNHFGALRRFGFWLAIAMGAYLLFGILRATLEPLWTPTLGPLYQWQIVCIGLVLLLVGIAMRELHEDTFRPDTTHYRFEPDRPVQPKAPEGPITQVQTNHSAGIVALIVLAALLVGGVSAVSSARHEATLAEKLCAQADARISDGVEQAARDGAGLFDRVFGTQTADAIPCADN